MGYAIGPAFLVPSLFVEADRLSIMIAGGIPHLTFEIVLTEQIVGISESIAITGPLEEFDGLLERTPRFRLFPLPPMDAADLVKAFGLSLRVP
jgi:hypothetical protein